ncbi:MAG: hypothetical protein WED04_11570 [Promethearchaeati archaeon SRVP18_Atabeyarchaeia-1]
MRKFTETVKAALRALNAANAEYVVVGGLAAIFYGRPRTTSDVDIIIDFAKTDHLRVADSLKREGFEVTLREIQQAISERNHFTVFDRESPYRLDIQGVYKALDEASLNGRRKRDLFGEQAWIESPEDLVVAKLVYGSQQDLEDSLAVLIRQKSSLNIDYLKNRAAESRVKDKLRKLLESSEGTRSR